MISCMGMGAGTVEAEPGSSPVNVRSSNGSSLGLSPGDTSTAWATSRTRKTEMNWLCDQAIQGCRALKHMQSEGPLGSRLRRPQAKSA